MIVMPNERRTTAELKVNMLKNELFNVISRIDAMGTTLADVINTINWHLYEHDNPDRRQRHWIRLQKRREQNASIHNQ